MNRNLLLSLLAVSVAINGALVVVSWPRWFPSDANARVLRERKPPIMKAAIVKQEPIAFKTVVPGILRASRSVAVSSDISGRIEKIFHKPGDLVKKGEIILQLDDRSAKAALDKAIANEQHASAVYKSFQKLKDIHSPLTIKEKMTAWHMAQAELTQAKLAFEQTRIIAPFDGFLGVMQLSEGAMIDPRQELTRLVSQNPMHVFFDLNEEYARMIVKGQDVDVSIAAISPLPELGKIVGIDPYSDATTHSVRVQVALDNPENKFREGAYAKVTVPLASEEQALVVPRSAVLLENNQYFVFKVKDVKGVQKVQKAPVIVGMREGERFQIEDGVQEGDIVLLDPEILVDGAQVRIEEQAT